MFGQPQDHPHGGPPRYSSGHIPGPPVGMTAGAPYQPPFARARGSGGGGAPGPYHFPHFPGFGLSQGYPPPSHRPPPSGLAHPPPLPGSLPSVAPPPPPLLDASVRSSLKGVPPPPPPAPKDAEMLKNIELLSSFVARNGPWFEKLTRDQHGHNPKFAFLFGGERGTEAAIGSDFYEWKKLFLNWEERSKLPSAEHITRSELSQQWNREELGATQLSHEVPPSPSGSDMDMEDDFAVTPPTIERKPTFERRSVVSSPKRERKSGFSSGVELPSQTSERRVGPASPGFERRSRFSSPPSEKKVAPTSAAADRTTQGGLESQVLELKVGASSSVPVNQEQSQHGTNVWSAASSDLENLVVEREKGSQVSDTSKPERESALPEQPRRRGMVIKTSRTHCLLQ
ncbi:hypothetical protein AXG93_2839s1290 [Marchantia polymorpha subsp. ruderalis]|uniref:SURP motif domain-containing protein n=1 Tax=Marchantia polymorpha subsp. ruderalis TaxID=1480154 RepID=A0A176VF11_MARPO|nr:hypothetical protein AXG93_2839s1290 [Marchantia polymorpha subsp. ruderalis]